MVCALLDVNIFHKTAAHKTAAKKTLHALACLSLLALPLSATTILNTYPDGSMVFSNGYIKDAQTFLVGSDTVLSSFEFKMFANAGQSANLQIFAWGGSGPTGSALFTSQTFNRINATQDFTVSNINLTLTQGNLYGAVIDNFGYNGLNAAFNLNQTSYSAGSLWLVSGDTPTTWNRYDTPSTGYDLTFQATFIAPAATASSGVPEPASFLLVGAGITALAAFRKRRQLTVQFSVTSPAMPDGFKARRACHKSNHC